MLILCNKLIYYHAKPFYCNTYMYYNKMACNTIQYYTNSISNLQYNKMPHNTIEYNAFAFAFCKMLLPNLAKDESSNHDSTKCSEISAVTWFRNCSGLLQVADRPHEIGACSGSKT